MPLIFLQNWLPSGVRLRTGSARILEGPIQTHPDANPALGGSDPNTKSALGGSDRSASRTMSPVDVAMAARDQAD